MADYIERQETIDRFENLSYADWNQGASTTWANALSECADMIRELPSADVVEVVRCEDCRWYKTNYMWNGTEVKICAKEAYEPRRNADDFCSYGEQKG